MSTLKVNTLQNISGGSIMSIGYGQTWQNVLASRAANTTYTNSTGRPIMVSIVCGLSGSVVNLTVGGVVLAATTGGNTSTISAIVPPGATYSISTASVLNAWAELR